MEDSRFWHFEENMGFMRKITSEVFKVMSEDERTDFLSYMTILGDGFVGEFKKYLLESSSYADIGGVMKFNSEDYLNHGHIIRLPRNSWKHFTANLRFKRNRLKRYQGTHEAKEITSQMMCR